MPVDVAVAEIEAARPQGPDQVEERHGPHTRVVWRVEDVEEGLAAVIDELDIVSAFEDQQQNRDACAPPGRHVE